MAYRKVIVFGATGAVGSNAALTAQQLGAKVVLASRDPKKPIPGLTAAQEQAGSFERVQADLTQPETVRAAAAQTGAQAAFIYFAHGSTDHQRGAIEALKAGGVEFVVFLSSLTTKGDVRAIGPELFIPFAHAQVEIGLEEVFGKQGYAAVRPGYFASNLERYKKVIATASTVVRVPSPNAKFDYITSEDMGRVSGALLVRGREALADGKNDVPLAGPQLVTQAEVISLLGKVVGKDLKVDGFETEEEELKFVTENMHVPEIVARQMVKGYRAAESGTPLYDGIYDEAAANVERYGGKRAITIQEWLEAHVSEFK
jgi:uncharacterized protein YbjT (DUF2867 family)